MAEMSPETGDWTWINGQVMPTREARISVLDRGFLYGDTVFETVRTVDGRGLFLDQHLVRLRNSLARMGIDFSFEDQWIEQLIEQLIERQVNATDVVLRITVSRGDRLDGALDGFGCQPKLVLLSSPISTNIASKPLELIVSSHQKTPPEVIDPTVKSGNYLSAIRARDEARVRGADDAVLLSPDGVITELTSANLFWVIDQTVFTCDGDLVLNGITRSIALQLLKEHGIEVREGRFRAIELKRADEAFATSSIQGIRAIGSVDGRALASTDPASICQDLIGKYLQYCRHVMNGTTR